MKKIVLMLSLSIIFLFNGSVLAKNYEVIRFGVDPNYCSERLVQLSKVCRYTDQTSTSLSTSTHGQTRRSIRFNAI